MKYLIIQLSLLMCLLLTSCASKTVNAQYFGTEFLVTVGNVDDQITLFIEDTKTIIDIKSEFGIGSALFELVSGPMPDTILLHLHLKGLETLEITSSQTTITASMSSSDALFNISNQRVISSSKEYLISPMHPLWMSIKIVSPQSTNTIPLTEGYFEVILPKEFIQKAGNSFEIKWIDFYR